MKASFGGEPVKGELQEQYEKHAKLMRFNGKNRASLGIHGSLSEALDDRRRWKEYLKW